MKWKTKKEEKLALNFPFSLLASAELHCGLGGSYNHIKVKWKKQQSRTSIEVQQPACFIPIFFLYQQSRKLNMSAVVIQLQFLFIVIIYTFNRNGMYTYYFQPRKNTVDHRTERYSNSLDTTILNVVWWWTRLQKMEH